LTNQKKQLEEEKQQLEELLIKFAEDKEEMEARHDNLDVATNDYKLEIAELKNDLEEIAEKLQVLKILYFQICL
jgi:predicted  nucleic acid-binding Zn-ribbon protein